MHFAKRETCPALGQKPSPQFEEYDASYKTSTKGIVDSLKGEKLKNCRDEWKILTLKEIRRDRQCKIAEEPRVDNRKNSSRKIFVSIAKSNSSVSKEKNRS
jgi:hypothetical protein